MRSNSRSTRDAPPARPESDPRAGKRRGFLLALGAGGVGAAAVAVRSLTGHAPAAAPDAAEARDGEGYRLTEHVKHYYRTAKI